MKTAFYHYETVFGVEGVGADATTGDDLMHAGGLFGLRIGRLSSLPRGGKFGVTQLHKSSQFQYRAKNLSTFSPLSYRVLRGKAFVDIEVGNSGYQQYARNYLMLQTLQKFHQI